MPSSLEIFRACHGGLLGLFTSVDIIGIEGYSVLFQWYRCTPVYMSRSKLPFIHFDINFRLVTYYSDTVMTSPDAKIADVSHLRSFSGQACVLRVVHSVFGKLLVFFLTQRHGVRRVQAILLRYAQFTWNMGANSNTAKSKTFLHQFRSGH